MNTLRWLECRAWVICVLALILLSGCSSEAVSAQATRTTATATATATEAQILTSGPRVPPIIHRPEGSSSGQPVPLLIVLHGSGGTPADMQNLTNFSKLSNKYGFVVAYLATLDPAHPWRSPADRPYISAMIDRLVAAGGIDRARVYITGFSAGGRGIFDAACSLSAKVAAVAVVEGGMPLPLYLGCSPSRPVSELLIVGDADKYFYPGIPGVLPTPFQATGRWRALDGCASHPQSAQVATVTLESWNACTDGSTVGLDVIRGGTHVWPAVYSSSGALVFDASEAVWSFVSAHRLAPPTIAASFLSLRVTRVRKTRVTLASFRLDEPVTIRETVRSTRRQVAAKTSGLSRGANVKFSLSIPRKLRAGRYFVRLAVSDVYGRTLNVARTVRVPRPPR